MPCSLPRRPAVVAVLLCALVFPAPVLGLQIVASITPLHSLVAGITRGVAEPRLLLNASASPHHYSLRPSQARALEDADLVVWVGPALETFLKRALARSGPDKSLPVMSLSGVTVLPTREDAQFSGKGEDDHGHGHGHTHSKHGDDPHIWLDPDNALAIVDGLTSVLSRRAPEHASRFSANAALLRERIGALDSELRELLAPVRGTPFLVFHDAYHGFERHYGVLAAGAVTLNPQRAPGAARIKKLRKRITDKGARCVFSEPQFEPRLVATLLEGTGARTGVLDPMGVGISPGPDAWFALMRRLAGSLHECLAKP